MDGAEPNGRRGRWLQRKGWMRKIGHGLEGRFTAIVYPLLLLLYLHVPTTTTTTTTPLLHARTRSAHVSLASRVRVYGTVDHSSHHPPPPPQPAKPHSHYVHIQTSGLCYFLV
ncbi:hypothetical protein P167DRAFT_367802 [Morchella conica CCBAS932]|uniref:Uncharacterized protein n=1 Tax=Morchella conica CCBAS932 TaxID=1392247 RepID=A0A3N4KC51_9PEZI|nr:hypothetical protein P167DRAFT_367802 [Morchella conica CCBAS932]